MAKVAQWPNAKRDGIGAGLVDLDGAKQHCSDDCDVDRASDALHSADDAACHAGHGVSPRSHPSSQEGGKGSTPSATVNGLPSFVSKSIMLVFNAIAIMSCSSAAPSLRVAV